MRMRRPSAISNPWYLLVETCMATLVNSSYGNAGLLAAFPAKCVPYASTSLFIVFFLKARCEGEVPLRGGHSSSTCGERESALTENSCSADEPEKTLGGPPASPLLK